MSTGKPNNRAFTLEQQQTIQTLRDEFRAQLDLFPDFNTEWSLGGVLNYSQWNLKQAKALMKSYLKYRNEYDFKQVQAYDFSSGKACLDMFYRAGFYNVDRQGRPVFIELLGESKPRELISRLSREFILNYLINRFERTVHVMLPICSQLAGHRVDNILVIYDFKKFNCLLGFDSNIFWYIKKQAKFFQEYYPSLIAEFYFINTPPLFNSVYGALKFIAKESTRKKLRIVKGPAKAELLELIAPENLPVVLGGTCEAPLNENPGPWKQALETSIRRKTFYLEDRRPEFEYYYTEEEKEGVLGKIRVRHSDLLDQINSMSYDRLEVRALHRTSRMTESIFFTTSTTS